MVINKKGKLIHLNHQQIEAVKQIRSFLKSTRNFLCLSGSAGTGKTTIIETCLSEYFRKAVVTATTHKAKRIITVNTGLESHTIHSILGLRPDVELENFSNDNLLFSKLGNEKISEFSLVVIDESSMINKYLYHNIKELALYYGTKIIYIGDPNQLPPVNKEEKEELSQIFLDDEIELIKLDIVERQKEGNPLTELYFKILSDINSKTDNYEKVKNIVNKPDGIEGYDFFFDSKEFSEMVVGHFKSNLYKDDSNYCKVLCFTNDMVNKWNNLVRLKVYEEKRDLDINVGETIMAYTNIWKENERGLLITNSHDYRVVKMSYGEREKIKGYWTNLIDVDTNIMSTVFILDKYCDTTEVFIRTEQRLLKIAKNAPKEQRGYHWKVYYAYRNKFLTVGDIKLDGEKIMKTFDYAYSITVHKSQGSTYGNILFDERDIVNHNDYAFKNRLKYVAVTRPTSVAFINTIN